MESLPYEIIESIADYLDTRDFDACLTVCKLWSVLFMKNVYTDIHIKSEFKLMLFLESLVIYPRCMDAGQYIKSLDMSSLTTADKFRKNSQVDIHATDALIHCLNIERLTLPAHADIIKTFLDPKMPEFTHLKYLHFRVVSNYTTTEILDCYYKYRSSLVYMNLKGLSRVFIKFTFDDIVNYLSSFGLLEELHIDLPIPHFQLNHTLNDIFDHCQRLNKVEYGAYMMNTPIHYYRRVKVYEPLAYLELNLIDFYLQDSFYIKSRFTQLETLSLIIDRQSNNKAEFWFNVYGDHSMTISFIKCPKTGTRTMVSKVYIPRGTILPYDEYLAVNQSSVSFTY
ncbi:hypothetical protein BDB01DRAFT_452423 [Pilobolus umbonatus]|nr:hypothetical protein BDB01DRAFT_452423 [Pilobolus umbonatus]